MAKDGTNRGGRRIRAGAKPDPLNEKLAKGVAATRLEDPLKSRSISKAAILGTVRCLLVRSCPSHRIIFLRFSVMGNRSVLTWSTARRGSGSMLVVVPSSSHRA